jgi:MFS family permease
MAFARFSALQHREFRLYWFGYVISVSGQQMLWVVEGWLIYELSGSKLLLGAHGLAQAIPATALSLFGGVIADKVDQRRLLIVVQLGQMVLLAVLASLALTEVVQVWHIIGVGALLAAVGSFENPARQAMFPHLVDREAMPNAVGMNAVVHPGTRIIAPPLAGFMVGGLMAATGRPEIAAGAIFLITSVGFAGYVLLLLQVRMPEVTRSGRGRVLDDLTAGIGFIWRNRIFAVLIGMAYYNMFFGLSLSVLFPVFAKDHLDVGAPGIGLMYTAMGVGSLLGATTSASLGGSRYQRWLLVGGSGMLGAFTIAFALSTWYPLSLLLLFVLGTGGSVFNVAVQTNLQMLVANEFRGRVMGVWSMVHTSVRPLGEMQLGAVAALASAPFALALSGAMVIVFALAVALPNRTVRGLGALRDAARADASRR